MQIFERGDSCIATDLFLYELKPVEDLPMLLSFSMNFPEELRSTRILVNVLKFLVKLCHKNQSIFAGYHSTSNENFMRFYIYTRKERSGLTEAITARAQQLGLHVDHVQFEEDENWQTYMNYLYPTQREFCSIISRRM